MTTTTPRRGFRATAATTAVAAALFLGTGTAQATDYRAITDRYLFDISLSEFADVRGGKPHAGTLDWSSDACSWSPDRPLGYDFTRACHRHDFGYRNYKRQSRFTETGRKALDDNFYRDMRAICAGRWQCDSAAWTYYRAVRQFGAS
ncbi:phospholipase [Qaidamihabitans albus]|uniref:phospholipase n=1 Tax=Qaidamihabitans albus TaxID=2795733 RepID=UPI0018F21C91|nr:phospholipase [Qaidamihabitans albus]